MKLSLSLFALVACCCLSSPCFASEILVNGDFEQGVYTSTSGIYTNQLTPTGWTPNSGFVQFNGYNKVMSYGYASTAGLQIGDEDTETPAILSQTFADVSGSLYSVTLLAYWGGSGDPNAYFSVDVDGTQYLLLNSLSPLVDSWQSYTFTFTGTGSDTLSFTAATDPSEWYVDNVSVTGDLPAASVTPEPGSLLLLGTGLAGLAEMRRRRAV